MRKNAARQCTGRNESAERHERGKTWGLTKGRHRKRVPLRSKKNSVFRENAREGTWCSGGDLNPHAFRHTPLKRTCLPFHHPSRRKITLKRTRRPATRFH